MDAPIPEEWRKAVCQALASGTPSNIKVTLRARADFQALFPGAFFCELLDAFLTALRNPLIRGRLVTTMNEAGTVYEFIFEHTVGDQSRRIYGKVNLKPDGRLVLIYSAHAPLKGGSL